jgi:penicillin V acylase-like amidase (Ntn superfamily)
VHQAVDDANELLAKSFHLVSAKQQTTPEDTMKKLTNKLSLALVAGLISFTTLQHADACSRILVETGNGSYITARSMDWIDPNLPSDLWIFPQGIKRNGGGSENELTWTSKYGSVITAFYGSASADGMNEKGLVGGMQYLSHSDYGDPAETGKPTISIGAWLQYFLDNFATVEEAVAAMQDPPFTIVSKPVENGVAAEIHMAISDATGDSAIFEYIDGELVIHHGRQYNIMTNDPDFSTQLKLLEYWKRVDGDTFLPGTLSATDRLVRLDYMLNRLQKFEDQNMSLASVFSVIRNISPPIGMNSPKYPMSSITLWRTVSDHNARTYYFDSAVHPSVFWVDLKKVNLKPGAKTMTLKVLKDKPLAGEVSSQFKAAEPFKFL